LARPRISKQTIRVSVTLDEGEYAALGRLGSALDLSAAWMIRRAVSEFVARHGGEIEAELPLHHPAAQAGRHKKFGGARGK